MKDIGPLLGADEGLNHQIVDTFATLSQTDLAWTEKIWASIAKTDGSLQVDFGLGKYQNRGIIDGFGGVSRGKEQWTVRGSRELASAPEESAIGPIHLEIVEPLKQIRFRLEPNDVQPISFDIVLSAVTPPFFEERNLVRNRRTGRIDVDVIRYHQGGWASGTVTVDGKTFDVNPDEWFGFRDHSWGVRQAIGEPLTDLIPSPELPKGIRRHEMVACVLPASGRNVLRDGHLRGRGSLGVQLGLHQRRERHPDARPQRAPTHQLRHRHSLREGRRTVDRDGVR